MTLPWQGTTEEISSEDDSRYETPGGAQNKVDVSQDYLLQLLKLAVTGLSNGSEAAIARYSKPYDVTYDWLKERLDASEQRFKNLKIYNVEDYGTVFDGVSDNSSAVSSAISAMPSTGGVLLIPSICVINTTISVNKTLRIIGNGFSSVITGSANPLIQTDVDVNHKLIIEDCKIVTTASNTGVFINKTWDAGAISSYELNNVWFHARGNAGSLLKIYGARESIVTSCFFSAELSWLTPYGTAIGIELVGDTLGGAMNLHFSTCIFFNIYQGVKGFGSAARPDLFAGFHFNNCEAIACIIGAEFANGGVFTWGDGMFDYCMSPVILRHWGGFNIHDNYIACKDETDTAIWLTGQYGNTIEGTIHNNEIFTYGDYASPTMTAIGIKVDALTGSGGVQQVKIHNNFFRNFSTAVYVNGKDFTLTSYSININDNDMTKSKKGVEIGTYSVNCSVKRNNFNLATIPITDLGIRTVKKENRVNDLFSNNAGNFTTPSIASTYTYQVAHGLYAVPTYAIASATSTQTRDLGQFSVSFDSTNIYFNYANPTASGLSLSWSWMAEV